MQIEDTTVGGKFWGASQYVKVVGGKSVDVPRLMIDILSKGVDTPIGPLVSPYPGAQKVAEYLLKAGGIPSIPLGTMGPNAVPKSSLPSSGRNSSAVYIDFEIEQGKNNNFSRSAHLKSGGATSSSSQRDSYQMRPQMGAIIYTQRANEFFLAIESASNTAPVTALKHYLKSEIERRTNSKVKINLDRVSSLDFIAARLNDYEPQEYELMVPKTGAKQRGKEYRDVISTGIASSQKAPVMKEIANLVARRQNSTENLAQRLDSMFQVAIPNSSKTAQHRRKVILKKKDGKSNFGIDIDAIEGILDYIWEDRRPVRSEFNDQAFDLLNYV